MKNVRSNPNLDIHDENDDVNWLCEDYNIVSFFLCRASLSVTILRHHPPSPSTMTQSSVPPVLSQQQRRLQLGSYRQFTLNNPHSRLFTLWARWYPGVRLSPCSPIRCAGMLPVLIVLLIHALAYITAVPGTLLPLSSTVPFISCFLLVLFHFVFISTILNYLFLVFIDPGSVPDDWKAPEPSTFVRPPPPHRQRHLLPSSSPSISPSSSTCAPSAGMTTEHEFRYARLMHERTIQGFLRYCTQCEAYKPDRSHHCSVCKRCILKMDHHCVFVNNCVSFYNHKFFISFVTYAFLGCGIISVISFPTFADIISLPSSQYHTPIDPSTHSIITKTPWYLISSLFPRDVFPTFARPLRLSHFSAALKLSTSLKTIVMIGYIISSAFCFALGVFVTLHFYLLSKGRTTIEMYEMTDPDRAPLVAQYDLGFKQNVKSVCGTVPFCWFCPTRAYIDGDGLHYERRDSTQRDGTELA